MPISSILPQILPQTSSQTQGNSRVSRGKLERNRMEHQTPSGFPGNFRKRKVLGTLWFPSGLPETLVQAKSSSVSAFWRMPRESTLGFGLFWELHTQLHTATLTMWPTGLRQIICLHLQPCTCTARTTIPRRMSTPSWAAWSKSGRRGTTRISLASRLSLRTHN